jgi:hypothetical protein
METGVGMLDYFFGYFFGTKLKMADACNFRLMELGSSMSRRQEADVRKNKIWGTGCFVALAKS